MENSVPSTCAEVGYYRFSDYLRTRFGCKVHKVSLHAGFTCPNRDGTVGYGGCAYCVNESFSPQAGRKHRPISEQMADGINYMSRRYHARKFFAYFQAFTNTYADVDTLRACYDQAVAFPDVVGLSIGTRPDCVPDDILDLVQSYSRSLEVWVEYGLQSAHDKTLRRINRGHALKAFVDAVERTRRRGIRICVHAILGLPGENWGDMMETARVVSAVGIDGIKLHHLYVARGTPFEAEYRAGHMRTFTAEEYVRTACDFLERIPADIVVQRLVGDTVGSGILVAPVWPQSKSEILGMISNEFRRRGAVQGGRVMVLNPMLGA